MDELKEAQVQRQFFLRDAPMGPQPRAQQRPEALGSINMNLIEAVPVFVAGVFRLGCDTQYGDQIPIPSTAGRCRTHRYERGFPGR